MGWACCSGQYPRLLSASRPPRRVPANRSESGNCDRIDRGLPRLLAFLGRLLPSPSWLLASTGAVVHRDVCRVSIDLFRFPV